MEFVSAVQMVVQKVELMVLHSAENLAEWKDIWMACLSVQQMADGWDVGKGAL
jgi:hypothetical protein